MDQVCTQCGSPFEITKSDEDFYSQISVPHPKRCPDCRFMRRLTERNTLKLYKRKCDLTGKDLISPYHPDHVFPVYASDVWWSDKWDSLEYGMDFDFERPFFEQYNELLNKVPHQGQFVMTDTMQNSDYTNCAGYCKNCYLIAEADYDEDCYYSNRLFYNTSMVDCSNCYESELCYECINCIKCNNIKFSEYCQTCSDSFFLKNCIGCQNCIGCMNQRQKKFMIFNEQFSKEEYEKRKSELKLNTIDGIVEMRKKADDFFITQIQKPIQNEHNENCTGNHLYDSKNSFECFDCKDMEDCKYCARVFSAKTSMDYTAWGDDSELMYECACSGNNGYNLKFCTTCMINNSNLEYCGHCVKCENCFGCVGLNRQKFCILNKQYAEEEYKELKEKIVENMKQSGEYGEYFPKELCPYAFNETLAMEYFPLTKEEALEKGYKWRDKIYEVPEVEKIIPADSLPQTIAEVPDDILNWAVKCKESGRPFKIIKQELDYYRANDIPIPSFHFSVRYDRRNERRAGSKLFKRTCSNDGEEFWTNFGEDDPEKVYCEECYLKEVY
ncbi:zinc-ribbon domain-containing protein [Patescibacteria group bacterium]|nr:zinc-ribbon domain-containing protein [Patescibacteria group bacterium]